MVVLAGFGTTVTFDERTCPDATVVTSSPGFSSTEVMHFLSVYLISRYLLCMSISGFTYTNCALELIQGITFRSLNRILVSHAEFESPLRSVSTRYSS